MTSNPTINSIHGLQPNDMQEFPIYYKVGFDGITKIEYSISSTGAERYHIYKELKVIATVMAAALAEIIYNDF